MSTFTWHKGNNAPPNGVQGNHKNSGRFSAVQASAVSFPRCFDTVGFSDRKDIRPVKKSYATYAKDSHMEHVKGKSKYARLWGRPYIHTCLSYVHTPREFDRHACHKSLKASHFNKGSLVDSSDFGLLGQQSSQKWEIPCLGCR